MAQDDKEAIVISRMFGSLSAVGMVLVFPVLLIFAACAGDIALLAVQINPLCVSVSSGATQQFNATIFIDDVQQAPNPDNAAVTWSVSGGDINGTISNTSGSEGLYTAPGTIPPPNQQVTIIGTSNDDTQKQGQATAVINAPCPTAPPFTIEF